MVLYILVHQVKAAPISNISFCRPKRSRVDEQSATTTRQAPGNEVLGTSSVDDPTPLFAAIVEAGLQPVVLTTVQPYSGMFAVKRQPKDANPSLPPKMSDLKNSSLSSVDDRTLYIECKRIVDNMTVSTESVALLEKSTKQQAHCLLWHEHRSGRITASNFHSACKTNNVKPARSLIQGILTSSFKCFNTVPSIAWGVEHEADARNMYAEVHSVTHVDHTVSLAGLVVCKSSPFLAASPDGWVMDTCCGKGILEIKCPFSIKDEMPDSAAYLTRDTDGTLTLRKTHKYYKQVQGQLNICDVEYCDFVVWTTKGFAVTRVNRDKGCFDEMLPKLKALFTCAVLPQIVTGDERVIVPL
jgi:hypothetical protein